MRFVFTDHAEQRMRLRGVTKEMVRKATEASDKTDVGRGGRLIACKKFGARILKVVYVRERAIVVVSVIWHDK